MPHFHYKRPYSKDEVHMMLGPARALEKLGIPFVVFSEHALAFVHFVPTGPFDLTILVPDEHHQVASEHIQKELLQYLITQERDFHMMTDDGVCALPRAMRLLWEPTPGVLIVPQSHFHFDVSDVSRTRRLSPPCDPSDSQIRFPTMPAFLNALIDSVWEPVDSIEHSKFRVGYLVVFISYLALYNVRSRDAAAGCKEIARRLQVGKLCLYGNIPADWHAQEDTRNEGNS